MAWEITMDLKRILWAAATFVLAGTAVARSATIWVEGEKPATQKMNRHPWWYDQVKKGALSGGDWISNFSDEKEGMAKYDIVVKEGGPYDLWLHANPTSSLLDYRIDGPEWRAVDFRLAGRPTNIAKPNT